MESMGGRCYILKKIKCENIYIRKYSFCHFPLAPHYLKRGIPVSNVLHEVTKGTTDIVAATLKNLLNS